MRSNFIPGDLVMTPCGPGRVKYVFGPARSGWREPSYAVTVSSRRPGVIFHQRELSRIFVDITGLAITEGR